MAQGYRWWVVLTLCLTLASSYQALSAQTISGIVKNDNGAPVAGALVKISSSDLGLGFLVVSQAQGRYTSPVLPPGKYTVQGFGGTRQSNGGIPANIPRTGQVTVDIPLTNALEISPRGERLTNQDFEELMPKDGDGEDKTLVTSRCSTCHSLLPVISARRTREEWQRTLDDMRDNVQDNRMPLTISRNDGLHEGLGERIVDYLARNFGPTRPPDSAVTEDWLSLPVGATHPTRNLPDKPLEGLAAQYVAMEFSLPAGSRPSDIAVDSEGIAWVSEQTTGMIGRFDPKALTYTRIAVPPADGSTWNLSAVIVDPQDRLWFADNGPHVRILQFDTKNRKFSTYPIPDYPYPLPDGGGARIGRLIFFNENIWATGRTANRILRLDPATQRIFQYPIPRGTRPFGLAVGGDKLIWYIAQAANGVMKLDASTGLITGRYKVTNPLSGLTNIAADAEGNLWVTATELGKIMKVEYSSGKMTEYAPPTTDSGPYSVDVDTKRNLIWFSELFSDRITRFDPSTGSFVEFPQPSADSDVRRIEIDRSHPNRIWWAGTQAGKIGYIEVQ